MLLVFVKAARPGRVKTRLARDLGRVPACWAYCAMVRMLCHRLAGLRPVQLRYAPRDAGPEIRAWLGEGWSASSQGEGDLGERLLGAFDDAFAAGHDRVVAIGSDCPEVTAQDVEQGWHDLATHDLVLGPAEDGGYWMIGLNQARPALFRDIDWSTDRVFDQTLERAASLGLKVRCLQRRTDIDTVAEWRAFLRRTFRQGEDPVGEWRRHCRCEES